MNERIKTAADIQRWLGYWSAMRMVNVEEIKSLADVAEARKFCSVMRSGLFVEVSDEAIWQALAGSRMANAA